MPYIRIIGMGNYLPQNKILSSALDVKLGLASGSVEKNLVLYPAILHLPMKRLPIWGQKLLLRR